MNSFASYLLAGYHAGFLTRSEVSRIIANFRAEVGREFHLSRSGSCNPCGGGYMMDSYGNYRENFGG
jgi:hypothetical protein